MSKNENSVLWIVPEERGGIRSYTADLLPFLGKVVRAVFQVPTPEATAGDPASVIHIQHEYGLYGSKIPFLYRFPKWLEQARKLAPQKKWVATAHTVIHPDYRLPVQGRGWQVLPRMALNLILSLPGNPVGTLWGKKTWGKLDGVVVILRQQAEPVRLAGCKKVAVIPLPVQKIQGLKPVEPSRRKNVVLFGFFSPEKGQDIAIRAWKLLGENAPKLILAGGVRRKQDERYFKLCKDLIQKMGLSGKIEITGFVPNEKLESIYAESKLILAPFRESAGSASIATGFSYGAAVLASDLPLNLELAARVPGCLEFFKSESSEDLARSVTELLRDENRIASLQRAAAVYADEYSVEKVAKMHLDFYREVMNTS